MEEKEDNVIPTQSIAGIARLLCSYKSFPNRNELAIKVYEDFLKKGITKTNKGKPLTLDIVTKEINVITYECKKGIGAKIWKSYKIIETDKEFRILLI